MFAKRFKSFRGKIHLPASLRLLVQSNTKPKHGIVLSFMSYVVQDIHVEAAGATYKEQGCYQYLLKHFA